jgi:hypothetical protein
MDNEVQDSRFRTALIWFKISTSGRLMFNLGK